MEDFSDDDGSGLELVHISDVLDYLGNMLLVVSAGVKLNWFRRQVLTIVVIIDFFSLSLLSFTFTDFDPFLANSQG